MKEIHASSSEMEFIFLAIHLGVIIIIKIMIVIGFHKPMNTLLPILNCFEMFDISLRYADVMFWYILLLHIISRSMVKFVIIILRNLFI